MTGSDAIGLVLSYVYAFGLRNRALVNPKPLAPEQPAQDQQKPESHVEDEKKIA